MPAAVKVAVYKDTFIPDGAFGARLDKNVNKQLPISF